MSTKNKAIVFVVGCLIFGFTSGIYLQKNQPEQVKSFQIRTYLQK